MIAYISQLFVYNFVIVVYYSVKSYLFSNLIENQLTLV